MIVKTGTVLTVPGWNGSGPEHWQSLWEAARLGFRRVEQRDWHRPSRGEWIDSLERAVAEARPPILLVAHSLGCIAVAHWAANRDAAGIAGALLVAPPWLHDSAACAEELRSFLPMPTARLPFPSTLVASENDPYLPIEFAPRLARLWGSEFVNVGRQGHINIASGHGSWPAGERLLDRFVQASAGPHGERVASAP
jgi:predicted alpha/beta hydrolase family esterase